MRKSKKTPPAGRHAASRSIRRSVKRTSIRATVRQNKPAGKASKTNGIAGKSKAVSAKDIELKTAKLIQKGRDRGFVTYDEILKEFPQIENDIMFLDELYSKLAAANVD